MQNKSNLFGNRIKLKRRLKDLERNTITYFIQVGKDGRVRQDIWKNQPLINTIYLGKGQHASWNTLWNCTVKQQLRWDYFGILEGIGSKFGTMGVGVGERFPVLQSCISER